MLRIRYLHGRRPHGSPKRHEAPEFPPLARPLAIHRRQQTLHPAFPSQSLLLQPTYPRRRGQKMDASHWQARGFRPGPLYLRDVTREPLVQGIVAFVSEEPPTNVVISIEEYELA